MTKHLKKLKDATDLLYLILAWTRCRKYEYMFFVLVNRCLIELFCGVLCVFTLTFWHFRGCRGFCHRTESDLLFFLSLYDIHNNVTLYRLLKQVKCYITSFQGKHHYMQYRATHVLFIHIINQTFYKSLSFPAESRLSWQVNVQSCIGTSSESTWPTETIKNTTYTYITVLSFVEYID